MDPADQPLTTYFGTKHTKGAYGRGDEMYMSTLPDDILNKLHKSKNLKSILEMGEKERCPCPALFSGVPPELQTKRPLEVFNIYLSFIPYS